jgi:hypothetical protein
MTLQDCVDNIKTTVENAITNNGTDGKISVIRSQGVINMLLEVVKTSLIQNGVNTNLIHPPLGQSNGEKTLAGFLKFKKQDIYVFPNNKPQIVEPLDFNGLYATGVTEPYGELFTEHILSVNVRSQLSSIGNNIDTMYERTYAEPLNLHRRLPKMVLGEVYLLSVRELDSAQVALRNVAYKPHTDSVGKYIERYIKGFAALNMRNSQRDDDFKYERVALILVDFSQTPVKIYQNNAELDADSILPAGTTADMTNLSYDGFVDRLIEVYNKRFGTGILS